MVEKLLQYTIFQLFLKAVFITLWCTITFRHINLNKRRKRHIHIMIFRVICFESFKYRTLSSSIRASQSYIEYIWLVYRIFRRIIYSLCLLKSSIGDNKDMWFSPVSSNFHRLTLRPQLTAILRMYFR